MGITITNSGQGSVVRFRNLGRGGLMTTSMIEPLFLDSYTNAGAAYSLRKLSKTYSGPAIRVRRSSDNLEQDIGFIGQTLDIDSMIALIGDSNLTKHSEELDNWTSFNSATVNANVTTDPIGGNTADRVNFAAFVNSQMYMNLGPNAINSIGFNSYTLSAWVKSDTKSKFRFKINSVSFPTNNELFSPDITTTTSWTRYSYTFNIPTPETADIQSPAIANDSTGTTGSVFVWGVQLNAGLLRNYVKTISTATSSPRLHVTTWYDQSGNGRHATQTVAGDQPMISNYGGIYVTNSKPSIFFNLIYGYTAFQHSLGVSSGYSAMIGVIRSYSPSSGKTLYSFTPANARIMNLLYGNIDPTNQWGTYLNSPKSSGYLAYGSQTLIASFADNSISGTPTNYLATNNNNVVTVTDTSRALAGNTTNQYIGRYSPSGLGETYVGHLQELIAYNNDKYSSLSGIRNNINSYYTIYPTDTDVLAFISRVTTAGGTLSATEQTAVNQLVISMKAAGIWTLMKAVYPMVGASAAACAQNLKSSDFTGTFNGTLTYASTGVTSNGTTGYMNTNLNSSVHLGLDNLHVSVYLRTNVQADNCDIGNYNGSSSAITIYSRTSGNTQYTRLHDENNSSITITDSRGFRLGSRSSSTAKINVNNSTITPISSNSVALINANIYLMALSNNNTPSQYTTREVAFASIGDGLTNTQAADFYTAVQTFQITLGRQV